MHRIVIINHYAGGPSYGMEFRTFYFAREWVKLGHSVLVIGANVSHLRKRNPEVRGLVTSEEIDGVKYLWVRTPWYTENGVWRALNMFAFIAGLFTVCRSRIIRFAPDLVIASSTYTFDNWPAAYYAKKTKARYVYELHDLWPLTLIEVAGMSRRHPFVQILQWAENFACRRADKVISLLPATLPHLVAHGMRPDRFAYIPNGIVEDEWVLRQPVPQSHVEAIRLFKQKMRWLVGYVGGHNDLDPLEQMLEAGVSPDLADVGFVLVGEGVKKVKLERWAREKNSRVLFLPAVDKTVVPELLQLFDVLYLGMPNSPLYRFGISPNKLFEYMMAERPILFVGNVANDLVAISGCGITVKSNDTKEICNALRRILSMAYSERAVMGKRGRAYVERNHIVRVLALQFLDAIWPSGTENDRKSYREEGRVCTQ